MVGPSTRSNWGALNASRRRKKDTMNKSVLKDCLQLGSYGLQHVIVNDEHGYDAPKPSRAHHVIVIDCSYSMVGELPQIVSQLHNKLPSIASPGDFLTIIWFSGRREAGRILDHEPIESLRDVARIQGILSKWLKPVGLTGFLDPTQLAIESFKNDQSSDVVKNLIFMSDGCENQSSRSEVLAAFEALGDTCNSATVVEYGYYADRTLLSKLAERAGGSMVLAKDFPSYEVAFEQAVRGGRQREKLHNIGHVDCLDDILFAYDEGKKAIRIFVPNEKGEFEIPIGLDVFYLYENRVTRFDRRNIPLELSIGFFTAIATFAHRMKGPVVRSLMEHVCDTSERAPLSELRQLFARCFGKQRTQDFVARALVHACIASSFIVKEHARTINDECQTLIDVLQGFEDVIGIERPDGQKVEVFVRLYDFLPSYNKISRSRDDVSGTGVHFRHSSPNAQLLGLTWNEKRANISILTKQVGYVLVPDDLMPVELKKTPGFTKDGSFFTFPSHIFRNYAIVRDGIINTEQLPVAIGNELADTTTLDFSQLAVINWRDVKSVSAQRFFRAEIDLHHSRAEQKVLKALLAERVGKKGVEAARSLALSKIFGDKVSEFLGSVGVTDNGFAPKHTKAAAVRDYYIGQELSVTLKGMNDLPTVKDVRAMIQKGKITPRGMAMAEVLRHAGAEKEGVCFFNTNELKAKLAQAVSDTRRLIAHQARTRFAIIVGQVWFSEFSSLDEGTMIVDGIECRAELKDVQVEV